MWTASCSAFGPFGAEDAIWNVERCIKCHFHSEKVQYVDLGQYLRRQPACEISHRVYSLSTYKCQRSITIYVCFFDS